MTLEVSQNDQNIKLKFTRRRPLTRQGPGEASSARDMVDRQGYKGACLNDGGIW